MVVARPGWHYETEEDANADVEALIDQQLLDHRSSTAKPQQREMAQRTESKNRWLDCYRPLEMS